MNPEVTTDQLEGIVNGAVSGDRHAARRLFSVLAREHSARQDNALRTLARLDLPALWEHLLLFVAGQGWQGQHMPAPEYGVMHDLQHLFVQSFGQPLTLRQAAVRKALEHPAAPVRALAATLAGRQHHEEVIPVLIELLRDPYPEVRIAAAHSLTRMPDPNGIDALLQNMGERDFGVRWAACEALSAIGRPALPALLHHLIGHRLTPAFRETAAHAVPVLTHGADSADINGLMNALHGSAAGAVVPVAADRLLRWYEGQEGRGPGAKAS